MANTSSTAPIPTKLDYSRLLDDEFLNRGERVRVHTLTRGAANVLGSSASLEWRGAPAARCTTALLKVALALALMAGLTFVGLLVIAQQHHSHLRALAMAVQAEPHPTLLDHAHHHRGHEHDDDHDVDDDHSIEIVGAVDTTQHHNALAGGRVDSEERDSEEDDGENHPLGIHEHVLPGDVVLEDHHILPVGEPEPTKHAVVVCLPLSDARETPTPAANTTASATPFPLNLSRHQRDVVQSVAEYLSASAKCHVVVLRGVADENANEAEDDEEASVESTATAASTTASTTSSPAPRNQSSIFGHFSHSGCGSWSSEEEDDAGAAPGGSLALPGGKVVPVVLWDAAGLFSRSPLAEVWQGLHQRRAKGTASTASTGTNLLDLSARLQLLWRYGGVSVDLQSSADQVLKALSAFNRTDSTHVYLETTRGALIAAPQTCNAVVFDLIAAITKQTKQAPPVQEHAHYDDDDVRVFDGVLNDYCRSRRKPRDHDGVGEDESRTTASSGPTSSAATASTTTARSNLLVRLKGAAAFGQLRAGPPSSTTTPHPEPQDIRVDATQCRGNLVAISLA